MRILLGLAGVLAAGAAQAQPQADYKPAEDKVVCKRLDDGNTGSTFKRWTKVCKKKSEWAAETEDTFMALQRAREKGAADASSALPPGGTSPR